MLTGELRSQIDRIWDSFWSGGISNPMEVLEQITYLLFMRRLDELHTLEESKAIRFGKPIENRVFPPGADPKGRDYADLRWSKFKSFEARDMYAVVSDHVFPFMRSLGLEGSSYSAHMQNARFTVPTPALLAKVVDALAAVPMEDRDTKGDLYEYMLGKIASAGQNGQFRTPRHIIRLMVELTAPTAKDVICDPAAGTCGFLVVAGEYLRERHPEILRDAKSRQHFHHGMFHGYDFDHTMLRIGSMNMALHGVEGPDIRYRDSLAQDHADDAEAYTLILANPPFAGSLDFDATAKDLQAIVKTRKTELLFMALFLRLLKPGGRAAVVVPDGVLFGSSKAHKELRRLLVDGHKLDAVISLPGGVFKPYAGVSTAILLFTKTNSGGTDQVWFYDLRSDGWSLDDKRQPLLAEDRLGAVPAVALNDAEHAKNNLPDVLARWRTLHPLPLPLGDGGHSLPLPLGEGGGRDGAFEPHAASASSGIGLQADARTASEGSQRSGELNRSRTEQSFCVPRAAIEANGYDLSLNRYKEVVHDVVPHRAPGDILAELERLEGEIQRGMRELAGMVR